ncbi:ABC transporter permease [Flavonifractor plautii]|nr:ABC transporter permease [Flavonifractor plautii]
MGISFSLSSFWELLVSRWPELVTELFRHINMTTLALLISLAIGVPLGILITRNQTAAKIVIGIANVMQSIPSIALLSLAVCFLGIGTVPAILMVFVYAFLPILKNTYTGIMSVDPKNLEVARGMGLTRTRCLFLVELPIAAPLHHGRYPHRRRGLCGHYDHRRLCLSRQGSGLVYQSGPQLPECGDDPAGRRPGFPCWRCSLISSSPSWSRRSPVRACFPTSRSRICPRRSSAGQAGDRRGRVCRPGGGRHWRKPGQQEV